MAAAPVTDPVAEPGESSWEQPQPAPYQQPPPYQGNYGQPYGQPYGQAYAQQWPPGPQGTNGMAIASLVLGIVWICGLGSILALVFGYMGKNQIDRSGGAEGGRGLAVAGIVLGWIGVALLAIFIVLSIIGAIVDTGSSSQLS